MQIDTQALMQHAKQVQRATNRGLTWHNLSQLVAKLTLIAFGSLWLRVYWQLIQPRFFPDTSWDISPALLWSGALDGLLAFTLAIACATVPAIFWSGLIPSSPANILLSRLTAKYGAPGYYFAFVGALIFTSLGAIVLNDFWIDRATRAPEITHTMLLVLIVASLFLMVGFPAWALNRMTPEQYVDAITQAREVARVQRILELEEMTEKAIIARARAILFMDISTLTAEQRAANNREIAAILAAAQRGMQQSLYAISRSFESLYGMALIGDVEDDEAVTSRYKFLAQTLDDAANTAGTFVGFTERVRDAGRADAGVATVLHAHGPTGRPPVAVAAAAPAYATVAHQDAETGDWTATGSDQFPGRYGTVADRATGRPGDRADDMSSDALDVARQVFGVEAWMRSHLESTLRVKRTTALEYINAWIAAGVVIKLSDPHNHYQFVAQTQEVSRG